MFFLREMLTNAYDIMNMDVIGAGSDSLKLESL